MIPILEASAAADLLTRKSTRFADAEAVVRPIIDGVRMNGDAAVRHYAEKFDGFTGETFLVDPAEVQATLGSVSDGFKAAVLSAAKNIRAFAAMQLPREQTIEIAPGVRAGQVVRPLDTICGYVPGGRYPLPSTVLMTVIPAQVAGVPDICIATPRATPEILATAALLGGVRVFTVGGAQAIAAFALGTETIPKAARIVGPGNVYVSAAKKLLAGEVGIDFIAGPTEIVIIAHEGNAAWIAADMLAQAEHDPESSAILLTTSRAFADEVASAMTEQLATLSTASVAREALVQNSAILLVRSDDEAIALSNRLAPEHLSVPDRSYVAAIQNAGSIFIGPTSPEAAGDYASGPNHVLPTSGVARVRGGLSAADYVKVISTQEVSAAGLRALAPSVTTLARAEGLEAHARSVEVRLR